MDIGTTKYWQYVLKIAQTNRDILSPEILARVDKHEEFIVAFINGQDVRQEGANDSQYQLSFDLPVYFIKEPLKTWEYKIDLPGVMVEAPADGDDFWIIDFTQVIGYSKGKWRGSPQQRHMLQNKNIYDSEEGAFTAFNALQGLRRI